MLESQLPRTKNESNFRHFQLPENVPEASPQPIVERGLGTWLLNDSMTAGPAHHPNTLRLFTGQHQRNAIRRGALTLQTRDQRYRGVSLPGNMCSIYRPHFAVLTPVSVAMVQLSHIHTPIAQFKFHSYCKSTKSLALDANSNHHSNSMCLVTSDPYIQVLKLILKGHCVSLLVPTVQQIIKLCFLPRPRHCAHVTFYKIDNVKTMLPTRQK